MIDTLGKELKIGDLVFYTLSRKGMYRKFLPVLGFTKKRVICGTEVSSWSGQKITSNYLINPYNCIICNDLWAIHNDNQIANARKLIIKNKLVPNSDTNRKSCFITEIVQPEEKENLNDI